jgi:hypothetical protein
MEKNISPDISADIIRTLIMRINSFGVDMKFQPPLRYVDIYDHDIIMIMTRLTDEIIKLAKDCGMKYFVVTTKHHDGFALFHSKVDKYNVVDATPYKRDIVEDLANACSKHGVKLGFY